MTREKEFISAIKTLLNSEYIGDDCAYLKDLGITVTHDSLVEGVHFLRDFITPYQLGYKSVVVNLSDIASSGAVPKYLTISLSLPSDIEKSFVEEFYKGATKACVHGVKIVGGDITGGDKIFISVCAIGKSAGQNISSRKYAKPGYKIIIKGNHGSSAAGLKLLLSGEKSPKNLVAAHLEPVAHTEFGIKIGATVREPYAMTDTSDGLADALGNISSESGVMCRVDFDKIPYDKELEEFKDYKDLILFGGEDYGIVAAIPESYGDFGGVVIGEICEGSGVCVNFGTETVHFSKSDTDNRTFNHFSK